MKKPFTIKLSDRERELIEKARGKLTLGAFIRKSAVEAARLKRGLS